MVEQAVLADALLRGAGKFFETMVFMNLEESSDPTPTIDGQTLLGLITFKGNLEGSLGICCSVPCARAIAVNMLGLDTTEEISEEEIYDALREVTNIVMGCFKADLADTTGDLDVSTPLVVKGQELKNDLGSKATRVLVPVNIGDEYVAELSLLYKESSE